MRKSNHHSKNCNIQYYLGHRHKHIAHLIDRQILLTKSIEKYCKIYYNKKILIKNLKK